MAVTETRSDLKLLFRNHSIPAEQDFAALIDGALNLNDDGLYKNSGQPLTLVSSDPASSEKHVLRLEQTEGDGDWTLSLNPRTVTNDPGTARAGLNLARSDGSSSLFLDQGSGAIGVGTIEPVAALDCRVENTNLTTGLGITVMGAVAPDATIVGGQFHVEQPGGKTDTTGLDIQLDGSTAIAPEPDDPTPKQIGGKIFVESAPGKTKSCGLDVSLHCGEEHTNWVNYASRFVCDTTITSGSPRADTSGYYVGGKFVGRSNSAAFRQRSYGIVSVAESYGVNRIGIYAASHLGVDYSLASVDNLHQGSWAGWFHGDVKVTDTAIVKEAQSSEIHPINLEDRSELNHRCPQSPDGLIFFMGTINMTTPHSTRFREYLPVPDYAVTLMDGLEPMLFIAPDVMGEFSTKWRSDEKDFEVITEETCIASYMLVCRRNDATRSDRPIEVTYIPGFRVERFIDGSENQIPL